MTEILGVGRTVDQNELRTFRVQKLTWFPIDTAPPKKWVLVRCSSGMTTTPYRITVAKHDAAYRPRNPWIDENLNALTDSSELPTHWMPLEPFLD